MCGVTGKIPSQTSKIVVSHSGSAYSTPNYEGRIYYIDGTVVDTLKNGNNDVSKYNNGLYWFKISRGDNDYNIDDTTHEVYTSLSVTLSSK